MSTDPDTHHTEAHDSRDRTPHAGTATPGSGRPVTLEPVPPGWWLLIGGGILAALGPLFGFLVGSMIGRGDGDTLSPLYVWMLVGLLVGGVGVVMALLGGHTIYDRSRVSADSEEDSAEPTPR